MSHLYVISPDARTVMEHEEISRLYGNITFEANEKSRTWASL